MASTRGLRWDKEAIPAAKGLLTDEQIAQTEKFLRIGGAVICTALVKKHRLLNFWDAKDALIECKTVRYGLVLEDVQTIEAIPARGKQGIWYIR